MVARRRGHLRGKNAERRRPVRDRHRSLGKIAGLRRRRSPTCRTTRRMWNGAAGSSPTARRAPSPRDSRSRRRKRRSWPTRCPPPRRSCELSGAPGSLSTLNVLGCLRVAKKFPGSLTAHRRSFLLIRTGQERAARGRSGEARTASTALVSGESAEISGSTLCGFLGGGRARGAWVTLGWRECHGAGE